MIPPFAPDVLPASGWVLLLALGLLVGLGSWARARLKSAFGTPRPPVPGTALWLAALALVLARTIPLPPMLRAWFGPGAPLPEPSVEPTWRPWTTDPLAAAHDLVLLSVLALVYSAASRELADARGRRSLFRASALAGALLVVALPRASGTTPEAESSAAALVPTVALSLGLVGDAWGALRAAVHRRRHRRWLALGEPAGAGLLLWGGVALVVLVGLLASGARAGALGLVAVGLAFAGLARGRRVALAAIALVLAALASSAGTSLGAFQQHRQREFSRPTPDAGVGGAVDAAAIVRAARRPSLFDYGLPTLALSAAFVALVLRNVVRAATQGGALEASGLAAVCGLLASSLVNAEWWNPAAATTHAVLVGSLVRGVVSRPEPA